MEMVLFSGCQGAGKSTFFADRFFATHVRVSLDMLKTRHRERRLVQACLEMRQRFVVDNTNPTTEDRRRYFDLAEGAGFKSIGYAFDTALDEVLLRNAKRVGAAQIPELAVRGTFKRMQALDWTEGFDELFTVSVLSDRTFNVVRRAREV